MTKPISYHVMKLEQSIVERRLVENMALSGSLTFLQNTMNVLRYHMKTVSRCESDCLEILRKIAIVKSNKCIDTNTDI